MNFNYEITNVDNYYIYLTVYLRNNITTISYHLYKKEIDFFKRLRNNIDNKDYRDIGDVLSYEDETLLFSFNLHDGGSILNIDDKEFIKHMCDVIISTNISWE